MHRRLKLLLYLTARMSMCHSGFDSSSTDVEITFNNDKEKLLLYELIYVAGKGNRLLSIIERL